MYKMYGGELVDNLSAYEKPGEELFVEACVNASGIILLR